MRRIAAALLVSGAALIAAPARALTLPAAPQARVNDYAGIIPADRRAALEAGLARFEADTSTQIFIATFPSLDGEILEDTSNRLFNRWVVGQKGKNNGVLLVVFLAEQKIRIETGYGVEGALTDAVSSRIILERMAPAFREKRYADGIEDAVAGIEAAVRNEYTADPRTAKEDRESPFSALLFGIIILVILFIVLPAIRSGGGRTITGRGARRYRRGGWGWPGGFGGTGWGGGAGSWGGGGGGGFSGGGGGLSGGGGASGGW